MPATSGPATPETIRPLLEWIPEVSPRYSPPRHLAPVIVRLESYREKPLRDVYATPPRHGKTETLLHFVAHELKRDPKLTFGYATYGADLAKSKSAKARQLAAIAGVKLSHDIANLAEWRTTSGGGVLAAGVGGPWTGHGLDFLIVDDPVKNRLEAESATMRERTYEWFTDSALTRVEPKGSIVVNMARWHPDDLAGRLLRDKGLGYTEVRLPALGDDGQPLWPERWPLAELLPRRRGVGEYTWASLFQGIPRARGGKVFGDAHVYEKLPEKGYRIAIGLDLAYTKKTQADWSVMVVLFEIGDLFYVADVVREQERAPEFATRIRLLQQRHPTAPIAIYKASGPEQGVIDMLSDPPPRGQGIEIEAHSAQAAGDKFVRAQPFAAAWNAGKVLVPKEAPWLDEYLVELADFTGVDDANDDQVDASASGYDELVNGVVRLPDFRAPKRRGEESDDEPWDGDA